MTERPILFSAPMIRALLAGTNTQTRRVAKIDDVAHGKPVQWVSVAPCTTGILEVSCPYGEPGDRLWVKETFVERSGDLFYRADEHAKADYEVTFGESLKRWKPSIHMPRAASRITLEITGVRVEKLQEISEADARAEGVPGDLLHRARGWYPQAYHLLWEQINGPGSWAANPFVWVLEFRRLEQKG